MTTRAFAYLRTLSATSDCDKRQRQAIAAYAKKHNITIESEFYDPDTKDSEPVYQRPAFAAMLATIAGNGVCTIIIDTASRFARDLIVQETGYQYLRELGIMLIAADDPDAFTAETSTAILVRQVLGVVAQFQKAELVAKLRSARDRKRVRDGRCEGRKPAPDAARSLARRLHRKGLSLRAIGGRLADEGFLAPSGKPYLPQSIKAMLD